MGKKSKAPLIDVYCAGGCGKFQRLRKSRMTPARYYVCNSECEKTLPIKAEGVICEHIYNAAGGFDGVNFRFPTPEDEEAVARARRILEMGKAMMKASGKGSG